MKISRLFFCSLAAFFVGNPAFANTYTFNDTWNNWNNNYALNSNLASQDENGTPKVSKIIVTTTPDNTLLTQIDVIFSEYNNEGFNSLFINTNWTDSTSWEGWTYFLHDGESKYNSTVTGAVPEFGLYAVKTQNYQYTYAGTLKDYVLRTGNPNGIDANSLDSKLAFSRTTNQDENAYTISYSFNTGLALNGGFFVAYSPWCANDVAGGGIQFDPVPEPTTMLLFGSGLLGLAGITRRRSKN